MSLENGFRVRGGGGSVSEALTAPSVADGVKFERRWPKLQRIARSLCALSSPSASSDRTRAGRARSHPPPAGLSPPARPPARPTNFDEASERFGEPDLRTSPWPYLLPREYLHVVSAVYGGLGTYERAGERHNQLATLQCSIPERAAKHSLSAPCVPQRVAGTWPRPPKAFPTHVLMSASKWAVPRASAASPCSFRGRGVRGSAVREEVPCVES